MKTCTKCHREQPLDAFWRSARSPDGRLPRCIACERAYAEANVERVRKTARAYRERNAEKVHGSFRAWAAKNKERINATRRARRADPARRAALRLASREYLRAWRALNRDERARYLREWRAADPDARRPAQHAAKANRRARERANGGRCSAVELRTLMESQNGRCIYCGASVRDARHLDHKVPLCRGGDSSIANLQYLCPGCNLAKATMTHEEFVRAKAVRCA